MTLGELFLEAMSTGVITNGLFAMRPADVLLLGTTDGVKTLFPR